MTFVGAILRRAGLGSCPATRAKRQIIKLRPKVGLTTAQLRTLWLQCLYAAGSASLRLRVHRLYFQRNYDFRFESFAIHISNSNEDT